MAQGSRRRWDFPRDTERVLAAIEARGSMREAARLLGCTENALRSIVRQHEIKYQHLIRSPAEEAAKSDRLRLEEEVKALNEELHEIRKAQLDDRAVRELIFKLPGKPLDPPKWVTDSKGMSKHLPGVPTLFLSDWHWGEVVDPEQVDRVNAYDMKLAHMSVERLTRNAVDLLTHHVVNPQYPGLVVPIGGDMISGTIHEELMTTNEVDLLPSFVDLMGAMKKSLEELQKVFKRLFIPVVAGNHGRLTKKMPAKNRNFTNLDWLLGIWLEQHFRNIDPKGEAFRFNVSNGPDVAWRVYGHRYLMTHGDQFRGGDGMIGPLGPITRGDHKKRSRNSQINQPYDTLIMGHWHQYIPLRRLIVNGSLKGYDEFAHANNFPFESPAQALWLTHPTHGITISMPVFCRPAGQASDEPWVAWRD